MHLGTVVDVTGRRTAAIRETNGSPGFPTLFAKYADTLLGPQDDISIRDWQSRTLQWFQGKAWDRTAPVGPVVVTPDDVDPVDGLEIVCRVNGEVVQHDSTSTLVFGAAALVSYISGFTVLRPGDVVQTGTPGGVGMARTPPRFLEDGDVVETEISGIGLLRNTIRFTGQPG